MRFVVSTDINFLDASNNPITLLPSKDTIKKIDSFMGDVGKEIVKKVEIQKRRAAEAKKMCIDIFLFIVVVIVMVSTLVVCFLSGNSYSGKTKVASIPNYQIFLEKVGQTS